MIEERYDKGGVAASFNKAANLYDQSAFLQQEIGKRLLERLDLIKLNPSVILDAGGGTGNCSKVLSKLYPKSTIIITDFAEAMLRRARQHTRVLRRPHYLCVCADVEHLPFVDQSFDFIFSNLMLQWCKDYQKVFYEISRVLKPGGLLLFSTLGPDTLKELRSSWHGADRSKRVNDFTDMHNLGDSLSKVGFKDLVMDREDIVLSYRQVRDLLGDIKKVGANYILGRSFGGNGISRNAFQRLLENYENLRDTEGYLPATYEVVYGHAIKGEINGHTSTFQGIPIDVNNTKSDLNDTNV